MARFGYSSDAEFVERRLGPKGCLLDLAFSRALRRGRGNQLIAEVHWRALPDRTTQKN